MGLPLLGPRTWIHQAHLTGPVRLHFYPLHKEIWYNYSGSTAVMKVLKVFIEK